MLCINERVATKLDSAGAERIVIILHKFIYRTRLNRNDASGVMIPGALNHPVYPAPV